MTGINPAYFTGYWSALATTMLGMVSGFCFTGSCSAIFKKQAGTLDQMAYGHLCFSGYCELCRLFRCQPGFGSRFYCMGIGTFSHNRITCSLFPAKFTSECHNNID